LIDLGDGRTVCPVRTDVRTGLLVLASLALAPRNVAPQAGSPLGPEFRVNTYTTNTQSVASVAAHRSGNFVVVWESIQIGSLPDVYGQRFGPIVPVELMRFGVQ
jgi:hypothetical protein